jgi:hypothetical protein
MSEKENVETIQPMQVTPTPAAAAPSAAPATPVVEAAPATPEAAKPQDDKAVAAFIKQRQQHKADKQRIAALEAQLAAPQSAPAATPPALAPVAPATITPVQSQAKPTEPVVVLDETAAIQATAMDKDVQSVPGAIMDIMDIVDTDPRIGKLNAIDTNLAYAEAKKVWLQRLAIAPTPPIPVAVKTSGGMSAAHEDLASLFAAVDKEKPGTKAYREAVAKVNEVMNKR